jgi:hypothetical protein
MPVLEDLRFYHEDIECIEHAAAKILLAKSKRALRTSTDHCLDFLSRKIHEEAVLLQNIYSDADCRKLEEIAEIAGEGAADVWHIFYGRIRDSKEYTRKYSDNNQVRFIGSQSYNLCRYHSQLILNTGFKKQPRTPTPLFTACRRMRALESIWPCSRRMRNS